jgi:hypothetical protein
MGVILFASLMADTRIRKLAWMADIVVNVGVRQSRKAGDTCHVFVCKGYYTTIIIVRPRLIEAIQEILVMTEDM